MKDGDKCKEAGEGECGGEGKPKCYNNDKCSESFSGNKKKGELVKEAASATGDDEAPGKRLDYAATYELAINNLDKMLGKKIL